MHEELDIFEFLEVEDITQAHPSQRKRGRPPLTVNNPLDEVPRKLFINTEERPQVWLDDCLMGAIRACGTRDKRLIDPSKYVSQSKVFKTLVGLRGSLTPKRVASALGVSEQTGWRIVSVIKFATFSIERQLNNPSRILEYTTIAIPRKH